MNTLSSAAKRGYSNWQTWGWSASIFMAFWGLFTINPIPSAIAALLPMVLCSILWNSKQPQVPIFAVWMQSFPVIAAVINANRINLNLDSALPNNAYLNTFLYAASGMIVLAYGLRSGLLKSWANQEEALNGILKINDARAFRLYIIFFGFSFILPSVAYHFSALTQFILPLSLIRYFFAFLIFQKSLLSRHFPLIVFFILLAEVAIGFTGFFSGFKTIFYVFAAAVLASSINPLKFLRPRILPWILALVLLSSYWQFIKPPFRGFLDQGTNTQSVRIGYGEIANFHLEQFSKFSFQNFLVGFDSGLERISYLDYFAGSVNHVPSLKPYQNGRLWSEAVQFLIPRFLNPNKLIANDSDRTNQFSGQPVAGADQGTSISIGYFGESYIDFGFPLMLLPIALMGWIWGKLYSLILLIKPFTPLNLAVATLFLLSNAASFEASNLKLLSGSIIYFISFSVFCRFFGSRFWRYLTPGGLP
ncbi:hypothetical protein [Synechococcus sp. EJ6-Ellesmere]|uniref:hypothetical protein n=1 Tax=Synechococcus sp. EJ6-Ellesmere TaxID=2823734 RepID=UPI0020CD7127|nr:hypothetical protein [Synechococcus sp. EJ6-Ellesmere]MCP9825027.1 hypothetical protein [Synechococcus sp. EJ6-Ellesmere]